MFACSNTQHLKVGSQKGSLKNRSDLHFTSRVHEWKILILESEDWTKKMGVCGN